MRSSRVTTTSKMKGVPKVKGKVGEKAAWSEPAVPKGGKKRPAPGSAGSPASHAGKMKSVTSTKDNRKTRMPPEVEAEFNAWLDNYIAQYSRALREAIGPLVKKTPQTMERVERKAIANAARTRKKPADGGKRVSGPGEDEVMSPEDVDIWADDGDEDEVMSPEDVEMWAQDEDDEDDDEDDEDEDAGTDEKKGAKAGAKPAAKTSAKPGVKGAVKSGDKAAPRKAAASPAAKKAAAARSSPRAARVDAKRALT